MPTPNVIIFCAGKGERWTGPTPKYLAPVPIDGEAILDRTVRQLKERGVTPVIDINDLVGKMDGYPGRLWADSALMAFEFWGDETMMLLGDVFWTDAAMDVLFASEGLRLIGREHPSPWTLGPGEPFALRWCREHNDRVRAALQASKDDGDKDPEKHLAGSIWQMYRHLAGIPLDVHATDKAIWLEHSDWTDDFDIFPRYQTFLKRYGRRLV